jgi:hypothetical protein
MIVKLERIGDETINSLIMKKVVCLSVIWNVNTAKEHQNDRISIQGFLMFRG